MKPSGAAPATMSVGSSRSTLSATVWQIVSTSRWKCRAAFGLPVVPEVKANQRDVVVRRREVRERAVVTRQSLADPDWALKISLGRGAEAPTCEFTNCCEGLDQKHKSVTCQLWDKQGLDRPGVTRSSDGKRRLTAPDWTP